MVPEEWGFHQAIVLCLRVHGLSWSHVDDGGL